MKTHVTFVTRREKEHATFGNVPDDGLSVDGVSNIHRTATVQNHQAVGQRMQLSVVWTFPLYRRKGRRPAQSFARPTNVGLKLIQDTMGILYSKSRFRLHQPNQQVADIQNTQQLNRKPKAVSTSHDAD